MQFLILFNPAAHGGRAGQSLAFLEKRLQRAGLKYDLHITSGPGDARKAVSSTGPGAYQSVVAAGGDGTLFEVVNGLMDKPAEQRESLGILPVGTGNAFSRDLGLQPGDLESACDLLERGVPRPVDVAEVTSDEDTFHFINMFGIGLVTEAAHWGTRLRPLGRAAYTLGALAALAASPKLRLELDIDGETQEVSENLFLQLANSCYTGTHFCMAPGASLDDGHLELVLVDHLPRRRALKLFPTIYSGEHVHEPEVHLRKIKTLRINAPEGLLCTVDGEFIGRTPLSVRCIAGALKVIAPAPEAV